MDFSQLVSKARKCRRYKGLTMYHFKIKSVSSIFVYTLCEIYYQLYVQLDVANVKAFVLSA